MLGEIAFDHPLFSPLAGAQFSDFTKIHFWKHRRIKPAAIVGARVLARFENGDPAVLEKKVGKGNLIVMTSGWNPADSQLARSSKFVALMSALLDLRDPHRFDAEDHTVGDRVAMPSLADGTEAMVVHKPDGKVVSMAAGRTFFDETDVPGVYEIETKAGPRSFVVNLDPSESKTSPLAVETLEQFGCRLVNPTRARVDRELLRQMQNTELESRQKLWRWLILAAIGVLIVGNLAGGPDQTAKPDPRGGPVDMSGNCGRHWNKWRAGSGASDSGAVWRPAGCCWPLRVMRSRPWRREPASDRFPRYGYSRGWPSWRRRRGSRASCWRPDRPETRAGSPAGSRRSIPSSGPSCWPPSRRSRRRRRSAGLLAGDRRPRSPRAPTATTGTKRSRPG